MPRGSVTCSTCPKCGYDLEALHALKLGELTIEYDGAIILWRGQLVGLTPNERLIVMSLARADGAPVKREALAEVTGYEGDDPSNIAAVLVTRINRHFRDIDPSFDRIENVRGQGLRWRP